MPVFLLILLYMFMSFHIYAEDENTFDYKITQEETNELQSSHKEKGFILDRSINISKNQIKSSEAKNTAELIKEYSGIDIKNKTVYSQSTFILNGKVLNNEEKKVYLFLYNKDDIDSIYIDYYGSIGSIVYNILSKKDSEYEELLYVNLLKDVQIESDKTIKYVKTQTNESKSSGKMNVLEYNLKNQNNSSLKFNLDTSGEERGFSGKKSKTADFRSYINGDVDFKLNPVKQISLTGKYFVNMQTDIAMLNKGYTNNIKNQNIYQGGNIGISLKPHDIVTLEAMYFISSKKDLLTNNNQYLTTQGSKTSIIFNIPIKDISSTIRIKGNYSYLVGKNLYNVSVNNNDLPGLPRHQFNTSLEYIYSQNSDFESSILFNVQYIGDKYNNTTKSEVDKSYTTFDIISSFVFKKYTSLKFGVKNVLDVKYETIKGYPISSREYFVNVSAKLR
ncbi:TonB-dependent receptor domain-containing protein [Brachyspira hampsonii]|uniref:TonB-dependent receptor n=1 Tax=Brachyspira hampsonii 30446 TaxID=1289135 RepID=A0A2U4FBX6_9SPIR|nr:TonB-dependent receptor [Brachyspira hampsonii]EKV56954.1 TonB-dependent receptor [Brachyspira hampsonii 30446]MBW5389434.1 TonB-dependent receptor [Brachyspira hampsonii]MBW5393889.1 TonB-dependent receptor [Brachyspira hampsonii]